MTTPKLTHVLGRCAFVIALCAVDCTATRVPAQHTLRVGTWNLEHFGRRVPPRTQQQIDAIGAFVRELRVDVLAVQEIRDAAALARLCAAIGTDWQFVLGTTGGFGNDPNRIAVGFVWNDARVELLQAEELLHFPSRVDDLPVFHRKPVDAVFRTRFGGGFDFRAISVHLKAGRGGEYDEKSKANEAKRLAEVRTLREHVERLCATPGEDDDIVVLGDFNHTYGESAHLAFTVGGLIDYLRPIAPTRTIVHFEEPIDHIAIARGMRDDLRDARLTVQGAAAERDLVAWREVYSDHLPVTFELQADVDRDPAASFTQVGGDRWLAPGGKAAATSKPGASAAATPVVATAEPAIATTNAIQDPAAPSIDPASPLRSGDRVEVHHQSSGGTSQVSSGTLLAPLGDWVHVHLDATPKHAAGTRIAIPRERILTIVGGPQTPTRVAPSEAR